MSDAPWQHLPIQCTNLKLFQSATINDIARACIAESSQYRMHKNSPQLWNKFRVNMPQPGMAMSITLVAAASLITNNTTYYVSNIGVNQWSTPDLPGPACQ